MNNKITFGIGGIVVGIIITLLLSPMMKSGVGSGSMISGNNQMMNHIDRHFIEQMIPHHEMAVMMAQMLQGSTDRPEMKQLVDNIITSQTKEIEMMRT
ncbi:MAG: DUF305 domain-containing protein [Candidatus Taylorbacteria bacterium]|nr:DUF305 domain-containing protein [Candidatus Taylorbacteria bacterium]